MDSYSCLTSLAVNLSGKLINGENNSLPVWPDCRNLATDIQNSKTKLYTAFVSFVNWFWRSDFSYCRVSSRIFSLRGKLRS